MSDEYGDAADQVGEGAAGALEPALADRLDTMHRTLSTLGMRIDALVTSTTTYRSALTDRLNEYTDLVSKLTRAQAADLEEHRRNNDRAAAELRQGLAGSRQALEQVSTRIEAMAGGGGGAEPDQLLAELRALQDAQDRLDRSVTESLDRFGDRTTGMLEELRESLLDVASGEVVGALWDEFRGARASIDEMRIAVESAEESARAAASQSVDRAEDPAETLEPLRADVTSLTAAVRELLEQAEVVDEAADAPDQGMLTAVAADVASLRTELARGLVVEPSDALTGAVDQLRTDVAGLDTRLEAMTELQQAVAELRTTVAEVAAAPAPATATEPDPMLVRVDEHVTDLSQGLADIEARLATLADRLGAVDQLEGLEGRLTERLGTVDRLDGLEERLAGRLAGVDQLAGLEERIDERLAGRLGSVDQLAGMEDRLTERFAGARQDDGVTSRLVELDVQLEALQQRLGQQLEGVEQRLGGMDRHLAGIDEVHRSVTELRSRVEELAAEPPPEPVAAEDDATAEELRSVSDRVIALGERLDSIAVLQDAVTSLRDEVRAAGAAEPAPMVLSEEVEGELATLRNGVEAVDSELRAMRSGVEDIIARLDEGLVLADEIVPPAPAVPAEVDLTPVTELLEHVRDDIAAVPGRIDATTAEGERYATLDPDIVDLLREEIRGAGSAPEVPEDVLDQLRKELVALRRRIKLRAEGEILTDEQLELIADAVARKLAE